MDPSKRSFVPAMPITTFDLFPKLPTELRLQIWRLCLPQRVFEKDLPHDLVVFYLSDYDSPSPCSLHQTTKANSRPPVITRVCHESRTVAQENGGYYERLPLSRPTERLWFSQTSLTKAWLDRIPDSIHLNWTPEYDADFPNEGSPLQSLVQYAARASRGGSLSLGYFKSFRVSAEELMDSLMQLPSWMIVMRVIVIHADFATGASSGLFGLLGDAPVQLVDVSAEVKIKDYFDMAEKCEQKGLVTVRQDLRYTSEESYRQLLQDAIIKKFRSDVLLRRLHPVIMFRLCTNMCNHVGLEPELK